MRLFVDECCPLPLAAELRRLGHDVVHALEVSQGASDLAQAHKAVEARRILVSADYDFGEIAIRRQADFEGLVLIGPHPGGLLIIATALAERIHSQGDDLTGYLTLIEEQRTRRRRLFNPVDNHG